MTILLSALRLLHYAALAYGMLGWLVPSTAALVVYLIYLPLIVLQWWLNHDTCVLDSLHSRLSTGAWRAPAANPDEGQFIRNLVARVFGADLGPSGASRLTYGLLGLFFLLGVLHLAWRMNA